MGIILTRCHILEHKGNICSACFVQVRTMFQWHHYSHLNAGCYRMTLSTINKTEMGLNEILWPSNKKPFLFGGFRLFRIVHRLWVYRNDFHRCRMIELRRRAWSIRMHAFYADGNWTSCSSCEKPHSFHQNKNYQDNTVNWLLISMFRCTINKLKQ